VIFFQTSLANAATFLREPCLQGLALAYSSHLSKGLGVWGFGGLEPSPYFNPLLLLPYFSNASHSSILITFGNVAKYQYVL
jgi:hypothetical protein